MIFPKDRKTFLKKASNREEPFYRRAWGTDFFSFYFSSLMGLDGRENHFVSLSLHLFLKIKVTVFYFLP